QKQGRTDNSWGPRAIGDHGAPVSLPKLKKAYEKCTRGISWGPLLTLGPRAVPEFPNGQSAPWAEASWPWQSRKARHGPIAGDEQPLAAEVLQYIRYIYIFILFFF
ncbi:unnamed protein product, partial [Staurois parvus]